MALTEAAKRCGVSDLNELETCDMELVEAHADYKAIMLRNLGSDRGRHPAIIKQNSREKTLAEIGNRNLNGYWCIFMNDIPKL